VFSLCRLRTGGYDTVHLVDTHAHLNDDKYSADLPEVIERARAAGVERIICCGYDVPSSERAMEIASEFECVYATVGVHPHDAKHYNAQARSRIARLANNRKVVAVGEIGLDFHYDFSPREDQLAAFADQIDLARELKLPIVAHSRESNSEALQVLRESAANAVGCVFHCFSGDEAFAREVLDMGFYIGFDGPVTYKSSDTLKRVAQMCPADRILIETDCPYLTPVPYRGKRNEPTYVRYVAEAVAAQKGLSLDELAVITTNNSAVLFSRLGVID